MYAPADKNQQAQSDLQPAQFQIAPQTIIADNRPEMAQLQVNQAMMSASPQQQQLQAVQARMAQASQLKIKPNDTGLPDNLKTGIESLSGMSMDHVNVHYNSDRPAQLNAHAYAQGSDIHVAPGQEQHLPHEVWHVVQQAQGRVKPTMQMKTDTAVNDDPALEHEADVMGARAVQMQLSGKDIASVKLSGPSMANAVIQGVFAVQVMLDELDIDDPAVEGAAVTTHKELRISAVHIADRPQGLFSPDEKSHTTAWVVYTDQLRNAVLGRPLAAAVTAIHHLYTDSQHLPGVARVENLTGAPKATYDDAKQAMDNLIAIDIASLREERHADLVQRLAKGFLAYRNAIPLSQVDIGRATGHGEPKVLESLRPLNALQAGWEEDPDLEGSLRLKADQIDKARNDMWSLLDAGAIRLLYNLDATTDNVPGVAAEDGGAAKRIADLITQHLWTLENTYETLFRAASMDSEESIRWYLGFVGCRGLYQNLIYGKITGHYDAAVEKTTEENSDRYLTAGPAEQGTFSVQVNTLKDGKVSDMHVGGRAPTALGSDQGSHTTAWVVYIDAVRNVVVGKPFADAMMGIIGLTEAAKSLPGIQRVKFLDEKQLYWYQIAVKEMEDALATAKNATARIAIVPALQRMVKAYLGFRNAIPLSQIKGGLADGNAEGYNRAIIRYLESDFTKWTGVGGAPAHDEKIYLIAFWELYDYAAVYKSALHLVEPADAPGIGKAEDSTLILGDSIKQHLIAMQAAYPNVFAVLKADSGASINYVLNKMGIRDEYCGAIIGRIYGK